MFYRRFSSGTREKVLRWLFPKAELCPLLDSAGTILQRCLVTHSTNSQSKVSAHLHHKSTDILMELKFGFWILIKQLFRLCLTHVVCLRASECLAGWWWVRGFRQFGFCLFDTARSTAAPSTCGWHPETWVTPAAPDFIHTHTHSHSTLMWSLTESLSSHCCNPDNRMLLDAENPSLDGCPLWPLTRAVYADPRYWKMELFPGRGQNIICDGSAFWPPAGAKEDGAQDSTVWRAHQIWMFVVEAALVCLLCGPAHWCLTTLLCFFLMPCPPGNPPRVLTELGFKGWGQRI